MTPEEIRESLKNHIDNKHRKVTKEYYINLKDSSLFSKILMDFMTKKITIDEFKEEIKDPYKNSEIEDKQRDGTPELASIITYRFDENKGPKMDSEIVQIVY